MINLRELYQEVIIDHNRAPRNFYAMQDATHHADGLNPLCGDQLQLYLKIKNNVIVAASFQGEGCAISTASASLLTEMLAGKSLEEAKALFAYFHDLMTTEHLPDNDSLHAKLNVLAGVREFPARVKCATLPWHTLKAALQQDLKPASTE